MKISFSTKGWQTLGWQRLTDIARDVRLSGIELHDVFDPTLADVVLDAQNVGAARRRLQEYGLQVACVDLPTDPLGEGVTEHMFFDRLDRCIDAAVNMRTSHIRIHTLADASEDGSVTEAMMNVLTEALKRAQKANITLLLETAGMFSDTTRLKNTLDTFASDNLSAL